MAEKNGVPVGEFFLSDFVKELMHSGKTADVLFGVRNIHICEHAPVPGSGKLRLRTGDGQFC